MSRFDLSRLGAWRDLAFFDDTLPGIAAALAVVAVPERPRRHAG